MTVFLLLRVLCVLRSLHSWRLGASFSPGQQPGLQTRLASEPAKRQATTARARTLNPNPFAFSASPSYAPPGRMKIVHIITRLIIGGAQENTLLSCEGQHDRGHDVTLITGPPLGPEGSLLERATTHGYRVIVLNEMRRAIRPVKDYQTYRRLFGLLGELRPDVVHTHSCKAGIIGLRAA